MKRYFIILFLSFFIIHTHAQNEGLRFEHIGIEEGLSNNQVTAILQDRKGLLWFGTFDGLYKYDGYSFTKYQFDPSDPNSLAQNLVYTIFEDKAGTIWTSSFEGLCKFDKSTEKFTRYKPSPDAKFFNPNIYSINEDNDGMIWVGSTSGELCRFDRKTGKFLEESFDLDFRKLPGNKPAYRGGVSCIYKDRSGTLWVGNRAGLHRLNLTDATGKLSTVNITHYQYYPNNPDSLSSNIVGSVMEDRAGIIWVATDNGLNRFDRNTGKFKRYQHDPNNIHSISSNNLVFWNGNNIKEDREGNLWICTDKGLNKLNRDRTVFTAYYHNPNDVYSLSSNTVMSVQIDQAGILWAGSWTGKLNKANLHAKGFGLRRHDPDNVNSLSSNEVTSIVEDSSGAIWVGTLGGGLIRWDRTTNTFTHFRSDSNNPRTLISDAVHAILKDRYGQLWIGNGSVLSKFNRKTGEFTHYDIKNSHFIFSITEDREGLLWLGTGNGVHNFNPKTGEFKHYSYDPKNPKGISDGTAVAVYADSKDNIWVGYGSRATDKLNKRIDSITHYEHDANDSFSISSNIILSFYEDSKGNLWIGTKSGGICHFDYQKGKFTTFTNKHGLPDNTVYSILEDSKNHLWLGTGNGISRFDPATKTFANYDYKDGLQGNVFAAGERERGAALKGKDGTFYFGGINGFNFFDPLKITADSTIAPIAITQFKLFDSLVKGANESKEIVLDHDQNYFSFEFSSLSYYNPAKNKYAYQLEGVDKDWVYSGSRRYVGYTNIDPGTYTFRVKGTNNDGVWNEKGTYITIIIRPPFWQTWWFRTIMVITFLFLLYGIYRWRTATLRKQKRILEQTVKERTAEVVEEKAEVEKRNIVIQKEKEKSDELLLNILPSEVAEELKEKGYTTAKAFDEVTVLFSDIKGFTDVAENMTAHELVKEINTYFSAFDNIIQKYGLEKIKTIGDAYIAAGGLPEKNSATAQNVVEAAIAMQQAVEKLKQERVSSNKPYFELRIGIHTGPVVAGVVGIKKFQYDIWGDTVNLAARMEQSGVPGKINISQHTYEGVKEQFTCIHRGKIEAKNKGEIDMYFVE